MNRVLDLRISFQHYLHAGRWWTVWLTSDGAARRVEDKQYNESGNCRNTQDHQNSSHNPNPFPVVAWFDNDVFAFPCVEGKAGGAMYLSGKTPVSDLRKETICPSWKYGPVFSILRSVGTLKTSRSRSINVT